MLAELASIDERLDALTMNLEMLTRDTHELQRRAEAARLETERLDRRERPARKALLSGIIAYMNALEESDNGSGEKP